MVALARKEDGTEEGLGLGWEGVEPSENLSKPVIQHSEGKIETDAGRSKQLSHSWERKSKATLWPQAFISRERAKMSQTPTYFS